MGLKKKPKVFTDLLLNPEQTGVGNCGYFSKGQVTGRTKERDNNTTVMLWLYFYTLQSPALYIFPTYSITTDTPVKQEECIIVPILQKGTLARGSQETGHHHTMNYLQDEHKIPKIQGPGLCPGCSID